jgi:oligopeptide transport system permease protein
VVRYIGRRVLSGLLTLWIVMTLTFVMMHAVPGDPFTSEKNLPEAVMQNLRARYHLNDPLWKQYVDYAKNVATWELGPSFRYATRTVNQIIDKGFPVSAQLGGLALGVSLLVGVPMGIVSSLNRSKWPDHIVTFLSTIGISSGGPTHWIMPVISLAFLPTAYFAYLVRSSMLEVINQDYMRTAKAKGLPRMVQIVKHALRNAILPLITVLGPMVASVLTGSLVVERIFAIPGLGGEFVTSIFNRDYTVIMGVTIFYAVLIVVCNIVVDLLYALVDPRIKIAD